MAGWYLVPCLDELRSEYNTIAPNRSKVSDGTIGDTAHQGTVSDHNDDEVGKVPIQDADKEHEVHGLDITAKLNHPFLTMDDTIQHILYRCRLDNDHPNNEPRLRYLIWDRHIYEAPNWNKVKYTGDNPHTEHAHFSAEYVNSLSNSRAPWGLVDLVARNMTDEDIKAFWAYLLDIHTRGEGTKNMQQAGNILRYLDGQLKTIESEQQDQYQALRDRTDDLESQLKVQDAKLDQVIALLEQIGQNPVT